MQNANLLLYVNLSGEVFYIIAHRMRSQKVTDELQLKVYNDLTVAICHPTVVQNLIKGSLELLELNLADVRTLMDRIVHSSIMTVNAFSMEKVCGLFTNWSIHSNLYVFLVWNIYWIFLALWTNPDCNTVSIYCLSPS